MALSERLVDFLAAAGGEIASAAVVEHFAAEVGPAQAPLFRQLLQQVASLATGARGKVWRLREEFARAVKTDEPL